jgi:hypothetical protein
MGVPSLSLSLKKLVAHYARRETREKKVHPDQSNRFWHVKQKDTFGGLSDYRHLSQARLAQDQGHPQPSATLKNVCNPASSSNVPFPRYNCHKNTHKYISAPPFTSFLHALPLLWYTPLSTKKERDPTLLSVNSKPLSLSLSLWDPTLRHSRGLLSFSFTKLPKCKTLQTHPSPISLSLPLLFPRLDHNQLATITGPPPPPHFTTLARIFVDTIPPTTSPPPPPPPSRSRSNSEIKASNEAQKASAPPGA